MKRPTRLVQQPVGADRRVAHVPVSARRLLEVSVDFKFDPVLSVLGAVVWVRPREDTTPEQLAAFVERMLAAGAVRVIPLPLQARDAAAPLKIIVRSSGQRARAVVEALLEHVTEQPEEVKAIVLKALEESGL